MFQGLRSLNLLRTVPDHHLRHACETALEPCELGPGEVLCVEGEADDTLIIVVEGELDVLIGDPPHYLASIGADQIVGEMAAFGRAGRRSATVRTRSACRLVVLDVAAMEELRAQGNSLAAALESAALRFMGRRLRDQAKRQSELSPHGALAPTPPAGFFERLRARFAGAPQHPSTPAPDALKTLAACPSFAAQPPQALEELARLLLPTSFARGDLITAEGRMESDAWLLAEGTVEVHRATRTGESARLAVLQPATLIGVVALAHGRTRSASCLAAEPCWLFKLPQSVVTRLENNDTPGARALRQAIFEALASQLAEADKSTGTLLAAADSLG